MNHICEQSTLYAASKGSNFSMNESLFKRLVTILLLSGYVVMPRRPLYWQMREDTHNSVAVSLMARNDFDTCMKYLHLADNGNLPKNDKFGKIRPLIDHLNKKCLENSVPEKNICIDESMVRYFGKHNAKQYMKSKPTKFGYKIWCAATRLGYVITFEPYQGAGTFECDRTLGMAGTIVKELTSKLPRLPDCSYHIF